MCLAKAFTKDASVEPIMEDIAYIQLYSDHIELETLFGDRRVIWGKVIEINFSTSKIVLDQTSQSDRA